MEKIILTKRQAEALEKLLKRNKKESILEYHRSTKWCTDKANCLNELSLEQMAKTLYVGYEVEESKEEKLLSMYNYCRGFIDKTNTNFYKAGVIDCLDMLEIKIKGINA